MDLFVSHDAEACVDQPGDDPTPFPPCLRELVEQDDRTLSLAGRDDVKAQAGFDVGHAMLEDRGFALLRHVAPCGRNVCT
jgi:hypothetical protein